jgi:serine/threonine protein kinase
MLTGFGLAKASTDTNLTQTGTAIGVAQYMSPEQVKGLSAPDPRSDLYSLGVVLYEMVTGKVPFDANSQFEIMLAHVNTVPKPPSAINPEISADMDEVILNALVKDAGQRYQTAGDFSAALSKVARTRPGNRKRSRPLRPSPRWKNLPRRRLLPRSSNLARRWCAKRLDRFSFPPGSLPRRLRPRPRPYMLP